MIAFRKSLEEQARDLLAKKEWVKPFNGKFYLPVSKPAAARFAKWIKPAGYDNEGRFFYEATEEGASLMGW